MSTKLNKEEEDAVFCLLSVLSNKKRLFDDDSESSDNSNVLSGNIKLRTEESSCDEDSQIALQNNDTFPGITAPATFVTSTRKLQPKKKSATKKMMTCDCGAIILERTNWKHKQSKKHIQYMLRKKQLEAHIINFQSQKVPAHLITNLDLLPFFDRADLQGERLQQPTNTPSVLLPASINPIAYPNGPSLQQSNHLLEPLLAQWYFPSMCLAASDFTGIGRLLQPMMGYISTPSPPQQQFRLMSIAPETAFFSRDFSFSLSNFSKLAN